MWLDRLLVSLYFLQKYYFKNKFIVQVGHKAIMFNLAKYEKMGRARSLTLLKRI
jgi:hypothetical protein